MKKIFMALGIVMGISAASIAHANCCYNDAYKSLGFRADNTGTYGCSKTYCTTSTVPASNASALNFPGKGQCQCPYTYYTSANPYVNASGKTVVGLLKPDGTAVAWDNVSSCSGCGHPVLSAHFCE